MKSQLIQENNTFLTHIYVFCAKKVKNIKIFKILK